MARRRAASSRKATNRVVTFESPPAAKLRDLPAVNYSTFAAVCGRRPESMAGFNHYIKSSRLDRAYKTIPEWEATYAAFMARPTW